MIIPWHLRRPLSAITIAGASRICHFGKVNETPKHTPRDYKVTDSPGGLARLAFNVSFFLFTDGMPHNVSVAGVVRDTQAF